MREQTYQSWLADQHKRHHAALLARYPNADDVPFDDADADDAGPPPPHVRAFCRGIEG